MRVAKEQAKIRQEAATGLIHADHLVKKYQTWHKAQLKQEPPENRPYCLN